MIGGYITKINSEATNGDVIKGMFPGADIEIDEKHGYIHVYFKDFYVMYPVKWWNESYKRGD